MTTERTIADLFGARTEQDRAAIVAASGRSAEVCARWINADWSEEGHEGWALTAPAQEIGFWVASCTQNGEDEEPAPPEAWTWDEAAVA